jgi:hypothetical protein
MLLAAERCSHEVSKMLPWHCAQALPGADDPERVKALAAAVVRGNNTDCAEWLLVRNARLWTAALLQAAIAPAQWPLVQLVVSSVHANMRSVPWHPEVATALVVAGRWDIVFTCLERKAFDHRHCLHLTYRDGWPPCLGLMGAAMLQDRRDVAERLLAVKATTWWYSGTVFQAASADNEWAVPFAAGTLGLSFNEDGPDPALPGASPLGLCIEAGMVDRARYLIDICDARLHRSEGHEWRVEALLMAARTGNRAMVAMLAERGADATAAVHRAVMRGDPSAVDAVLLLLDCCSVNIGSYLGREPLLHLSAGRLPGLVPKLLDMGAALETPYVWGGTPLHNLLATVGSGRATRSALRIAIGRLLAAGCPLPPPVDPCWRFLEPTYLPPGGLVGAQASLREGLQHAAWLRRSHVIMAVARRRARARAHLLAPDARGCAIAGTESGPPPVQF